MDQPARQPKASQGLCSTGLSGGEVELDFALDPKRPGSNRSSACAPIRRRHQAAVRSCSTAKASCLQSLALDGKPLLARRLSPRREIADHPRGAGAALHARDRHPVRSGGQHRALRPLSLARHLLHPVRAGRLPPHHLFHRPARRARRLYGAHRGRRQEAPVLLVERQSARRGAMCPAPSRHFAVWHDPHPKPSYLFALVGGNLACVPDSFTTASGREVALNIYVEPGKEDRCAWAMESLEARHALGRGALRPRIRSRRVQHRRRERLQYGGHGEQGPQHLQRQARAGAARHRERRRLRRASKASSRTNISTTGPATASPAATGSSSASKKG